ncbi:MAG TPA: cob(I)yrinic acid a,c-diamide adenosyltransferase [Thermoanaerobaculia bacterium]
MRISKVYTRKGDSGTTSLVGGKRVSKRSQQVESYGTVDELQAFLGLLRAALAELPEQQEGRTEFVRILHAIQNDIFDVGNVLATPPEYADRVHKPVTAERVQFLEETMDGWLGGLPALPSFILSGGGRFSALAQVARTVCRRAEREALRLTDEQEVPAEVLAYLNRLSDFLFVLGRHLARTFGEEEPLWETPLEKKK